MPEQSRKRPSSDRECTVPSGDAPTDAPTDVVAEAAAEAANAATDAAYRAQAAHPLRSARDDRVVLACVLPPPKPRVVVTQVDVELGSIGGSGLGPESSPKAGKARVASRLWLTRADQIVLLLLSTALFALLAVHWVRMSAWGVGPIEIDRHGSRNFEFQVDINQATWVEWTQLDGIGDKLAHSIIADREQNGAFESVDDLLRVKGIGVKKLAQLRPWLTVTAPTQR